MFDKPESEYIYHEGTDYFRVTPKGESWDMIQYRADDSYSTDPNEVEKLIRVSTVQPITKHQWSILADSTMRKYNKSQQLEGHDLKLPRDPADPRSDISVAEEVKIHPDMAKKMSKDQMALADDILKQISTNHFGASVLRMQLSELLFDNDAVLAKAEQHYDADECNQSDAARAMFMMNSELVSMLHVLAHGMINGNVSIVNTIASKFAPAVKTTGAPAVSACASQQENTRFARCSPSSVQPQAHLGTSPASSRKTFLSRACLRPSSYQRDLSGKL